MDKKIKSPISLDSDTILKTTFNSREVIAQYQKIGLNVERFFEGIQTFGLYECNTTGYRFYYPFKLIGDAHFYEDLSLKRTNYYSTRWEHLKVLPLLNSNQRVLEIGSGFGVFLDLLKSKNIDGDGIELNPEAVKQCQLKGYNISKDLIGDFVIKNKAQYDVVCFFQVLEHITQVYDFINDSLKALNTNGKLIIGVPNNNPYLFVNDKYHTLNLPPHHAGLWNKKSLINLESIFPVKMESIYFEPLEKTYTQFLSSYIANSGNLRSHFLKVMHKFSPRILKKMLCLWFKGRNVLVVYRKIE